MTQKKASGAKSKPVRKVKPHVDKQVPEAGPEDEVLDGEETEKGSEPSLEEQLAAAQKKADDNWDQLLRTKAEMDNLSKRAQRDIENAHKYSLDKIANELLSVRDSMEIGLGAVQENTDVESLRQGAELTLKMLVQVMDKFAIQEVNPENQRFDPSLHQAMNTQESDQHEPNTVILVMQKGYTLNGRLLRPALVTVSKAPVAPK